MSVQYSARAPFYTYFYWGIFLFAGLFMAFILHRMIALASAEDEAYSMTTVANYRAQAKIYHAKNFSADNVESDDLSDI